MPSLGDKLHFFQSLNLNIFADIFPGHHVEMAQQHRALLLAVEHRFYGDSINPDGLKTESLADLSSQQALVLFFFFFLLVCFILSVLSSLLYQIVKCFIIKQYLKLFHHYFAHMDFHHHHHLFRVTFKDVSVTVVVLTYFIHL